MLNARPVRTESYIRIEARKHFDFIAERPSLFDLTAEQCTAQTRLGMMLVDEAFARQPGEVFNIRAWFQQVDATDDDKRLALGVMPFLMGAMGLFDWEFVHETVGILPLDEVRALLETSEPRQYGGVELTPANVSVRYRRRPLR